MVRLLRRGVYPEPKCKDSSQQHLQSTMSSRKHSRSLQKAGLSSPAMACGVRKPRLSIYFNSTVNCEHLVILSVNSVKQSDTKCHSEPCPEQRQRSGEESQSDCLVVSLLAMTFQRCHSELNAK